MNQNIKRRAGQRTGLRSKQQGVSLLLLLFIGLLCFIVGGAALRLAPTFIEYRAIQAAIDRAMSEGTPPLIRRAFNRSAAIDNITTIAGKDLVIEMVDGNPIVSFEYEKRVPLVGPVSLIVDYRRDPTSK